MFTSLIDRGFSFGVNWVIDQIYEILFDIERIYLAYMFQFDQDYLRVSKPITTDGLNLALDKDGKRRMKIIHMPLSAESYLKRRNEKLPDNLKLVIEKVEAVKTFQAPTNANAEIETLKTLLAQAEAEKNKLIQERETLKAKKVTNEKDK